VCLANDVRALGFQNGQSQLRICGIAFRRYVSGQLKDKVKNRAAATPGYLSRSDERNESVVV